MRNKKGQFHEFIELFSTGNHHEPIGSVGSYTPLVMINRGISIDNGTSSSILGMHQVGIEGFQRVAAM